MKQIFILIVSIIIFSISLATIVNAFGINGVVYNDKNCNGQRNGADSGIGGVTLTLNPGGLTDSTNPGGNYHFIGLSAGIYTVTITVPPAYCSTTPTTKTIAVIKKNIANQNFGISKLPASPDGKSCCVDED